MLVHTHTYYIYSNGCVRMERAPRTGPIMWTVNNAVIKQRHGHARLKHLPLNWLLEKAHATPGHLFTSFH